MASASPGDFYEQLSPSDQVIIDNWKDKRATSLRDMVQKEVESRLEVNTVLFRESTPFIRVFVKSYIPAISADKEEKVECEGAMLTVWNPTEQQLGLLREGCVVSLTNLSVRNSKHEGLLQLTAGAKTQIQPTLSSPIPQHTLTSIGYTKRSFVNLFRVQLMAKQLSRGVLPSSPAPAIDTAGILLNVSREGSGYGEERESIFITDDTGLLLRVERDHPGDDDTFSSLSSSARQNVESLRTIAFRDLRITQFDTSMNCAVAVFAETSSVVAKAADEYLLALSKWAESPAGHILLNRIASCIDAGVPLCQSNSSMTTSAVGYISSLSVPADFEGDTVPYLEISVDCGLPDFQVWHFPMFLLDQALSICGIAPGPVSLHEVDEKYTELKVLSNIFSARGILMQFVLRRKKLSFISNGKDDAETYEVRKMKVADAGALADTYLYYQKQRQMDQAKKARKK